MYENTVKEKIDRIIAPTELSEFMPDISVELEPSIEELEELEAENNKFSTPKVGKLPRNLDSKDYRLHVFRKKAYGDSPRAPIISNGKNKITCPHCGKEYLIKNLYHPEDVVEIDDDILYSLLRLYDFGDKCSCGKYLYGYYKEPEIPKWLKEALDELNTDNAIEENSEVKDEPKSTKKEEWAQLSFEDIFDATDLYPESTTSVPNVETVTMELSDTDSEQELKEQLSNVNVALNTFCKNQLQEYSDSTYFVELKTCKTAEITRLAKTYAILNFARMNNNEKRVSIGLLRMISALLPETFTSEQKLEVVKILSRKKGSSENELKSLHFFSDEEVSFFVSNLALKGLKEKYDELQTLTKRKMDLSKACIWGKSN